MTWGTLDEDALNSARELLGTKLRRDRMWWVRTLTEDAIRHFAEGIGDANPLWNDPDYGPSTPWGTQLAAPTTLYAIDNTVVAPRLPGIQWVYAGTEWTWYDVLRVGDAYETTVVYDSLELKGGRFAKLWAMQRGSIDYVRKSDGLRVARAYGSTARTPRGEALKKDGSTKYAPRDKYAYSPEELDEIEHAILTETPRGATPRRFEDVEVGEEMTPMVKPPLTTNDLVAWYSGVNGARAYGGAYGDVVRYHARHQDYEISKATGLKQSTGRAHMEAELAKDVVGMGGMYDMGPQRISWCANAVTHWMGDSGFLHGLSMRVLRPNLVGDTCWTKGTVTAKSVLDDGHAAVELELAAVNQRGEVNATGTATVLLPSTEHGEVRLPLDGAQSE